MRDEGAKPRAAPKLTLIWLAAVLLIAVVLRAAIVRWGLPNGEHYFSYHPDEIFLLLPSFGFASGDWNPHFLNYGSLYIYLVGLPAVLLDIVGKAGFPSNLRPLYQLGRTVTAVLGVATILLLYLALRRESRSLALLGALLLAICPLHFVSSGYATVDVPATFWLTLAFLLCLRGGGHPDARWGALTGLAIGLAAATKYNAGIFLLPAVLSPLLCGSGRWRLSWLRSWLWSALGGAALGFILGCPFFWTSDFRRGLLFEIEHARTGGTLAFVDTGPGWWYHLVHGLPVGLGFPLLAAAVFGVIAAVVERRRPARLALLWTTIYLLLIGFGKERFIRYLVPITPFLCLLAAAGIAWLVQLRGTPVVRTTARAAAVLAVALTALYALGQVLPFVLLDPRDHAMWRTDPPVIRGARVGLVQAPWFADPPVSPFNAGPFSRLIFEQWNRKVGNRVVVTGWDAEALRSNTPDAFILPDLISRDPIRLRRADALTFLDALDSIYADHTTFGHPPLPFSWLAPGREWAPPDWLYPSPRITVYYSPR